MIHRKFEAGPRLRKQQLQVFHKWASEQNNIREIRHQGGFEALTVIHPQLQKGCGSFALQQIYTWIEQDETARDR